MNELRSFGPTSSLDKFASRTGRSPGMYWIGLLVVVLFAASFLQLALLDQLAVPAEQRVNNGARGTYFLLHANPYYLFPEDFHLYAVRSQRIMQRGFTDAPLCHEPDEKPSYVAAFQVLVMALIARTEGQPLPYAMAVVGLLAIAWGTLYTAAYHWMRPRSHPLMLALAVLITVCVESITFSSLKSDFGQWPVHRGLRMATLAWTSPLALSVVIAATSLLNARHCVSRLIFLGMALSILAASDPWAFFISFACVAIVASILGVKWIFDRWRGSRLCSDSDPIHLVICPNFGLLIGLASALVLAGSVYRLLSGNLHPDVLMRSGFGSAFLNSPESLSPDGTLPRLVKHLFTGILYTLAISCVYLRPRLVNRRIELRLSWQRPFTTRVQGCWLYLVPITAADLLNVLFTRIGMDNYHAHQFIWRREIMGWFALVWLGLHALRWLIYLVPQARSVRAMETLILSGALLAAFCFHNWRIHTFVAGTPAREYFLTQDQEAMIDWLKQSGLTSDRFRLITASHELNYLCAFWTNCDLLLPDGFPYHNDRPNSRISERMAQVLKFYRCTSARWQEFPLHRFCWDQWSWVESRLTAARHGYMYYLFHRAVVADGYLNAVVANKSLLIGTQRWYAEQKRGLQKLEMWQTPTLIQSLKFAGDIAERLTHSPEEIRPDLVVIDEVSRFWGEPDLANYHRAFSSPSIEIWVRNTSESTAANLPSVR